MYRCWRSRRGRAALHEVCWSLWAPFARVHAPMLRRQHNANPTARPMAQRQHPMCPRAQPLLKFQHGCMHACKASAESPTSLLARLQMAMLAPQHPLKSFKISAPLFVSIRAVIWPRSSRSQALPTMHTVPNSWRCFWWSGDPSPPLPSRFQTTEILWMKTGTAP